MAADLYERVFAHLVVRADVADFTAEIQAVAASGDTVARAIRIALAVNGTTITEGQVLDLVDSLQTGGVSAFEQTLVVCSIDDRAWSLERCAPALWARAYALIERLVDAIDRPWGAVLLLDHLAAQLHQRRDDRGYRSTIRRLFSRLPADHPLRERTLARHHGLLSMQGYGNDWPAITRDADLSGESYRERHGFIDAVECGRLADAELRWKALHQAHGAEGERRGLVAFYAAVLVLQRQVRAGRIVPEAVYAVPGIESHRDDALGQDLGGLIALAQDDREGIARLHALNRSALNVCAMFMCQPMRAALVLGDQVAAGRLLARREALGADHWLDDLMRARLLLLQGDPAAARARFAACARAADHYAARGRLEFELRLAHDLDRVALAELGGELQRTAPFVPEHRTSAVVPAAVVAGERSPLVGPSRILAEVREQIARIATSDLPVLITGETGSGKEVAARAIHRASNRSAQPFVAVNCAAVGDDLLASELFGHARGAFTGASGERHGLLEEADKGTVLLDEIGDASPRFQAALLRLLERGEYRPVGANRERIATCRIIAATNVDVQRAVTEGRFRADLYYRLCRLHLHLPPLRTHPEDAIAIAQHLLAVPGATIVGFTPPAEDWLRSQPWPGNVRQLRALLERAMQRVEDGDRIDLHHLIAAAERTLPGTDHLAGAQDEGLHATEALPTTEAIFARLEPTTGQRGSPGAALTAADPLPAAGMADTPQPVVRSGGSASAQDAPHPPPLRRADQVAWLLRSRGRATRQQIIRDLICAPGTADAHLRRLLADGSIEEIAVAGDARNRWFAWRTGVAPAGD